MSTVRKRKLDMMKQALRIGYIPEHFSTPLAMAHKHGFFKNRGLGDYKLVPYPSGSGHLIQALKNQEVEIVIGLTEAFVRGIANGDTEYNIVGEYVKSPLCWSVSTGKDRTDLNSIEDLKALKAPTVGVSRIGSGSYVMSFVLALQNQFDTKFDFKVLDTFKNLRDSVNKGTSDIFMWEYFTTKPYYDNKEIKQIGEIYTPWPSWVVTASSTVDKQAISTFLAALQDGITYYDEHTDECLAYILDNLDYNDPHDLSIWASKVVFNKEVANVNFDQTIMSTFKTLEVAGVLSANVAQDALRKHVF